MDVANAAQSSHLSPEAVAAQKALLEAMWTVCGVYTEDFQNLHETHKLKGRKDLNESVDLLR